MRNKTNNSHQNINLLFLNLEAKVSQLDYNGFDPYDVKGHSLFMWAFRIPRYPFYLNIIRKVILGSLLIGESYMPRLFRLLFRIKPRKNAKGIALFAKGYMNYYKTTGDKLWLNKAFLLLDFLIENRSNYSQNLSWGYPFNWDNFEIIPAYSPASVVSAAVFDAFWNAWLITNDLKYLKSCESIAFFFIEDLNITEISEEAICFSYTPLDNLQVHNTNLMVADCLLKIGYATSNNKFITLGKKAANFAVLEQNSDGSLYYYGSAQNHICINCIDHYHSGFEIRSLHSIFLTTKDEKYLLASEKYYQFYLSNFLLQTNSICFPLMYPNKLYPINIHSCAESIILNIQKGSENESSTEFIEKLVLNIVTKMVRSDGFFKYIIRKIGPFEITPSIVYMRWSQAWMFLALSEYLLFKSHNHQTHK